ncbi:MAG: dephospho-CoA kinase [Bacteroidales bacterium]|nr:dephospho-CoA kinase [Bacteroidales bacterium]
MQKIGLTGGIGSGKTTVAKLFEMLGVSVFYADLEAHRIRNGVEVSEQIVRHFGNGILTKNRIDKQKLADIIFKNDEALRWVNNLIHPLVEKEFEKWCNTQKEHNPKFVIMESALIFEANLECLFDKIIVVDAPEELRIERVIKRENISKEEVLQRIAMQMSADEKCRRSDIIIDNDERQSLIEQVATVMSSVVETSP